MLITLFIILVLFLLYNFYQIFTYWKRKGIDYVNLLKCFHSFSENVLRSNECSDVLQSIYEEHTGKRYVGFYNCFRPILLVRDPNLARKITKQHYDHFSRHSDFIPSNNDPMWQNSLTALPNDEWVQIRKPINQIFIGKKLQDLFQIIEKHSTILINYFKIKCNNEQDIFELKEIFTRVCHDIVAPVAFGVTCDSLNEEHNELYVNCKKAFLLPSFKSLIGFIFMSFPPLIKMFTVKVYNDQVDSLFLNICKERLKYKEKHNVSDNNVIDLLVDGKETDLSNGKQNKIRITSEMIVAQSTILMFGAVETVSSILAYVSYHLAIDSKVQKQLYEEIENVPNISIDNLNSLTYLNNVISGAGIRIDGFLYQWIVLETMRLHPPSSVIDRMCVKSCIIEPENLNEKPLHIDEGTWIWILHRAMHYDKDYFPNPEKFDPDRFDHSNKHKIKLGTYIPFGYGPKMCIAMQFALLKMKIVLAHLLKNFEFLPVPKTNIVKEHGPSKVYPINTNGIWLRVKSRC